MPASTSRAVVLVVGADVLLCGGLTGRGTTTDAIWRSDPTRGRLVAIGHLHAAVHDAGGAVLGSRGIVFGGGRSGPGSVVQRVATSGLSVAAGRLPAARADLTAVTVGDRILVVGGGTPAHYDRSVLETTDGRRFRTIATLRIGVRYAAVTAFGGRVYVVGGSTTSGDLREIQVVDPATGVVSTAGRLPFGLSHASALVLGGQLVIAGGRQAGVAQAGVWRLDVGSGGRVTVTQVGHLPYPVSDAAAVVVDGIGYLLGGESRRIGQPIADIVGLSVR